MRHLRNQKSSISSYEIVLNFFLIRLILSFDQIVSVFIKKYNIPINYYLFTYNIIIVL